MKIAEPFGENNLQKFKKGGIWENILKVGFGRSIPVYAIMGTIPHDA